MKITIYELLGLIKDGKAPREIIYLGNTLYYDDEPNSSNEYHPTLNYYDKYGNSELFNEYIVGKLGIEVEILDNKKIEKLEKVKIIDGMLDNEFRYIEEYKLEDIGDKINEIIDKINEVE